MKIKCNNIIFKCLSRTDARVSEFDFVSLIKLKGTNLEICVWPLLVNLRKKSNKRHEKLFGAHSVIENIAADKYGVTVRIPLI